MKPSVLIRKLHSWSSIAIGIPAAVIIGTGILLQVKKQLPWVQPPEQRGSSTEPAVGLDEILTSVVATESPSVEGWDDVHRVDLRPSRGLAKVSLHSGWEAQVNRYGRSAADRLSPIGPDRIAASES